MFIAHGEKLRKYAPWIFAGVLLLLIPSFIALFTPGAGSERGRGGLPTIRGKPVDPAAYEQERGLALAQVLLSTGGRMPRSAAMQDALTEEAVRRIVLRQQAQKFGIHVSDADVFQQIRQLPMLHDPNHQFDPERYRQLILLLNNQGVGEDQFGQVIREDLMIDRLRTLVTAGQTVTPLELKLTYTPMMEKTTIDYVEFRAADQPEPGAVSMEDARAYFEKNKESFRKPACVKVQYAQFVPAKDEKTIPVSDQEIEQFYARNRASYADKDQKPKPLAEVKDEVVHDLRAVRANQRAADRATEFSVKIVPEPGKPQPDFAKLAAQYGATIHTTDCFGLQDPVAGFAAGGKFQQTASVLAPDAPFSDPVQGTNGYFVMAYVDHRPSELSSFEEVRDRVIDRLKRQRRLEATVQRGERAAAQVKKSMADGKTFSQAAAELKLAVLSPKPFSVAEGAPPGLPESANIPELSLGMPQNGVSDFIPTAAGGVIFHVKDRELPNDEQFRKNQDRLGQQLLEQHRETFWQSWMTSVMRDEQVDFGRLRRPPPTEEAAPEPETPTEPAPAPTPPAG